MAISHWLVYDDPSSSRLGITCKQSLLSLRSVGLPKVFGRSGVNLSCDVICEVFLEFCRANSAA